jgi:hypothetical protein
VQVLGIWLNISSIPFTISFSVGFVVGMWWVFLGKFFLTGVKIF